MLADRIIAFFTSLRLTVVCLLFGMILVFLGTLAQRDLGLYKAQEVFFKSFVVYWGPPGASWQAPVLPGGYLVGGVLLINLIASTFRRVSVTWDKAGLWMVHSGLILLLVGQLLTDVLSRESVLHLREGEAKNYSEAGREAELIITDTSDPQSDTVVSIPERVLNHKHEVRHQALPFTVRVRSYFQNSAVESRQADSKLPAAGTQGVGPVATVQARPHVTDTELRDVPSVVVELVAPSGSLGTWLASEYVRDPQQFTYGGKTYRLSMRPRRFYKPFTMQLLDFRHDLYPGTTIPKNFSSRVVLHRAETSEKREVLIYMNNPLRYAGETYYQSSFDPDNEGTVLQVVRNPSWLTPYFSCVLVSVGLVLHFAMHLMGFSFRRRAV
jgi:hypothetical protein